MNDQQPFNIKNLYKDWVSLALFYLVLVAFFGVFLRFLHFHPIEGVNFKNILHTHTHVALLGWVYNAFFIVLCYAYIPANIIQKNNYQLLFIATQVAVTGMLMSFPLQGYGTTSIFFSTMHLILSYIFIYKLWKDANSVKINQTKHRFSFTIIKASLIFLAISSLGPWSLGPIMGQGYQQMNVYYLAIYFYLHFQYNGWFSFALFGLFFWLLEKQGINFSVKKSTWFYRLMLFSSIPSYLLSTLWTNPPAIIYVLGGIAAAIQIIALFYLLSLIWEIRNSLNKVCGGWVKRLFLLALLAFILKIALQVLSAFPAIAMLAYKIRNFIIAYLHLVLLGLVSLFLLAFIANEGWLKLDGKRAGTGLTFFLIGFFGSEVILFLQSIMVWQGLGIIPLYFELLFGISLMMPLGLLTLFINHYKNKSLTINQKKYDK